MSNRLRVRLFVLAAGVFVLGPGCKASVRSTRLPPEEAKALLCDRNWLDHLPASDTEQLYVYRFVPDMGGGVFQDRTLYAGRFELFQFEHTGEEIRFHLPHQREHRTTRYRMEALAGRGSENPFDLRLVLEDSPRGPAVYYGVRGGGGKTMEALEQALTRLGPGRPDGKK